MNQLTRGFCIDTWHVAFGLACASCDTGTVYCHQHTRNILPKDSIVEVNTILDPTTTSSTSEDNKKKGGKIYISILYWIFSVSWPTRIVCSSALTPWSTCWPARVAVVVSVCSFISNRLSKRFTRSLIGNEPDSGNWIFKSTESKESVSTFIFFYISRAGDAESAPIQTVHTTSTGFFMPTTVFSD